MKAGKVIRNLLLGLAGLLVLLLVALQVLLRPSVLTGAVNRFAAEYVKGNVSFREVKAHVIKSFPYVNLEATDFSLTYPHQRYARFDSLDSGTGRRFNLLRAGYGQEGVDTLASFGSLKLSLNYMALLRKKQYHVHRLELEHPRIFAHYYDTTAANWDILPLGGTDTTSSALPPIVLEQIRLTRRPFVVFTHRADTLSGLFTLRRLQLDGRLDTRDLSAARAQLTVDSLLVSGRLPKDTVAFRLDHLLARTRKRQVALEADASARLRTRRHGRLQLPVHLELAARIPEHAPGELGAQIDTLQLRLSALNLEGAGELWKRTDGTLEMDLAAAIRDCPLGEIIQEYRSNLPFLQKWDTDACISLEASARGRYGNGHTPQLDAHLVVPPATLDYEGMGRKGRVALDASVSTDNLQEVDAVVDRLYVDIAGAQVNATAQAQDILGDDPLLQISGSAKARVDSLTGAFTAQRGILGTGSLNLTLRGSSRLSYLNAANIGRANLECDLIGHNLSLAYPSDSLAATLPQITLNLATKANSIDRNLKKGARVLALRAQADTLDVSYGSMFLRSGKLQLLMQNSADVLSGATARSSIMGILQADNMRMRDKDGLAVGVQKNSERFRLEPATAARPVPRLTLFSDSGRLRVRTGENVFSLQEVKWDVAAARHISRAPRIPRDSIMARLSRLSPQNNDAFAAADISISLSDAMRQYIRDWDIEGHLDLGRGNLRAPAFPLATSLSGVKGSFNNDTLDLKSLSLQAGASDLNASARLTGLRRSILSRGRSRLKLKANIQSDYLEANELLGAYAAWSQREQPAADTLADESPRSLLILPANLEADLSLEAAGIRYDSLDVNWAAADIAMRDRTLQITNALAATNMGDLYFEGFYSTRSKDNLKAGFNLRLSDMTAQKVIALVPAIDSILPMLTSFAGDLDCEMAVTSDIDTCMNLVLPSLNGVLRISGKELAIRGSEEFSRLASKFRFKNPEEAHVEQMAMAGIIQDNTLEVFPFVVDIDRYQLATSGQQHLDSDFLYHISVLRSPLLVKFGVNAWGPDFSHTHYDITRPRYRSSQVPPYSQQLDTLQFSLVAAIHNIFELGVDQAMLENRDAASHVSVQNEASLPAPGEEVPGVSTGQLAALLEEVEQSTGARREALRQEVLRLEKEAAQRRMAPLSF